MAAREQTHGSAVDRPTYGNWRKPTSPGLLSFGRIPTLALLAAIIFGLGVMMVFGLVGLLLEILLVAPPLVLMLVKDADGVSWMQRLASRAAFTSSRASGANLYRSGPLGLAPHGRFRLPGVLAQSQLFEGTDPYDRPFGLVHLRSPGTYTVVLAAEPEGSALVDDEQIDVWVAQWGSWLASLGSEADLETCSVTIETAPDTGSRLGQEIDRHREQVEKSPAIAQAMLDEVRRTYPEGSATIRAWVALTFRAAARGRGGGRDPQEMGRYLATRIPMLCQGLAATGAGTSPVPVSAGDLCELVHVAYNPRTAEWFDEHRAQGNPVQVPWEDVGPSAAEAHWGHYVHDEGVSITWEMTQAPRGKVFSNVLGALLAPHPDVDRKRVTLLYRPMDAGAAADTVERDRAAAQGRMSQSKTPSQRLVSDHDMAEAQAREEAAGAGMVNFGLLVTATVIDRARRVDAETAVENLGRTARLRLRRVHGSQDSSFAACLPLGVQLPKLLSVPSFFRENL